MNPVDLVPSRPTCRALARAGFPQSTIFLWERSVCGSRSHHTPLFETTGETAEGIAAPILSEVLAHLPPQLDFEVPHPVLGTVARPHILQMCCGDQTTVGYHLVGRHGLKHRTEGTSAVEAAARLYVALRAAGLLPEVEGVTIAEKATPPGKKRVLAKAA